MSDSPAPNSPQPPQIYIDSSSSDSHYDNDSYSSSDTDQSLPIETWNPSQPFPNEYCKKYIDAAFRSSRTNEAYLFIQDEYIVLDYANDTDVKGPLITCDGDEYPVLRHTEFESHFMNCAFRSSCEKESFIFSHRICLVLNYDEDRSIKETRLDSIIDMFPFLKETVFSSLLDAAIDLTKENEAYLLKGNQYALINYGPEGSIIKSGLITEGFPSLKSTIFESRIHAAFASHKDNEAYIFKGDSYALINQYVGNLLIFLEEREKDMCPLSAREPVVHFFFVSVLSR